MAKNLELPASDEEKELFYARAAAEALTTCPLTNRFWGGVFGDHIELAIGTEKAVMVVKPGQAESEGLLSLEYQAAFAMNFEMAAQIRDRLTEWLSAVEASASGVSESHDRTE